jgi:hypothetical protein
VVIALLLRASNSGSFIDSTSDGDSKARRSWPLCISPRDAFSTFRVESCTTVLENSFPEGGYSHTSSEAPPADKPVTFASVGPLVKHCVINALWLLELRPGDGFTIR